MDKIPEGAESLTVLVGGVKFLSEPIVAFVRLAQVRGRGSLLSPTYTPQLCFVQQGACMQLWV